MPAQFKPVPGQSSKPYPDGFVRERQSTSQFNRYTPPAERKRKPE
jgi:hypothetical protein